MAETLLPASIDDFDPTRLEAQETSLHVADDVDFLGTGAVADGDDVIFRHSGWVGKRRLIRGAMVRLGSSEKRLQRWDECGRHAWVQHCVAEPTRLRIISDKCHDRFCLPCSRERARNVARHVQAAIGPKRCRFVTLTLRNAGDTLTGLLDKLSRSFAKLRRREVWRRSQFGGIFFVEVKYSEARRAWHPHLHVLTVGTYICKGWLSEAWRECSGGSYIVDIRLVRDVARACEYVAKYSSKGVCGRYASDPEFLDEAITALRGRRLVGTWGSFRGLDVHAEITDEEWQTIGSLAKIVADARGGSAWARDVLDVLGGQVIWDFQERNEMARGP